MNTPTFQDCFTTTFRCPIPLCEANNSNRDEVDFHILLEHESNEEPIEEIQTQFEFSLLDVEESNFHVLDQPNYATLEQNMMSELNPLLSQSSDIGKYVSLKTNNVKFEPVIAEWDVDSFDYESKSTTQGASVEDLGDVENIEIKNINVDDGKKWLTCYSTANKYYHVKSGRDGHFSVKLHYSNVELHEEGEYFVRSLLIRSSDAFRHFPVNQVCEKHCVTYDGLAYLYKKNQPLQALPGSSEQVYTYSDQGARSSLIHKCSKPDDSGHIIASTQMIFMCNDSCINSSYSQDYKNAEAARDLLLVQTLEVKKQGVIKVLARSKVAVWPKASVCQRDLKKTERRKPKGAAAQKANRLKREINDATEHSVSKQIKVEPLDPDMTELYIDQLVKSVVKGRLTIDCLQMKIKQKLDMEMGQLRN